MSCKLSKFDAKNASIFVEQKVFDASICYDFKAKVYEALQEVANLQVDLAKVEMIDSSGIGALIHAYKLFHEKGGNFCLVNTRETVSQLIKVLRLNYILYDNSQEDQRNLADKSSTLSKSKT